ncbi:GntR family transcriptional regulator [Mesorhizobium sp. BH1-1-5]|uniref:GntR family transcriptional regulator n=1 Tax=Mesorhizobium sp. BH1-1-5 TaxID=2876661 RepID=UPI001CC97017|nr:GntR family transcriptional regulator [Mesorhizobium sp. BH1-1-5]MBZ9987037.1 GntR family transcriptional regulator [Mesorhizobium sp. BH1-1-5]
MDHTVPTIDSLPRRTLGRSNGPLYRQLADILRVPIGDGTFPVGGELPKEAAIAEHFGVSLITVRQALRDLEADGLIKKRSAKPAVVAARSPSVNLSWKFKNFADMAAFTKDAQLMVKSYRKEVSPVLQRHFGMGKEEAGYCLRSVLSIGEQRKAQITTYFPPDIGARLKREDFSDVLIFRSVQKHLGLRLDVAHVTVRAEIADEAVATDLGISLGSAVLTVEMLYQSADQRSIEFSVARHPADIFSITYDAPNDLS